jgi:CBS domain containing-hemolysin-like protein
VSEDSNGEVKEREAARSLAQTIRLALLKLAGRSGGDDAVREVLEELIEEKKSEDSTPVERQERTLLANILSLRERTIEDVMVPRADIVAVEVSTPLAELVEIVTREGHSRMPVYQGNLDNAIGMLHIKDLIASERQPNDFRLGAIVREVLFVSPSMHVLELLLEMRFKRVHMALVVDEFGGVDGLATIEDLVEEIVGDIEDEYDVDTEPTMTKRGDDTYDADARVSLESFEETVGPVLSQEERSGLDTLGGLVSDLLGRVPIRGEIVSHPSGIEMEVLDADPRRVKRLRIRNLPPQEPRQSGK